MNTNNIITAIEQMTFSGKYELTLDGWRELLLTADFKDFDAIFEATDKGFQNEPIQILQLMMTDELEERGLRYKPNLYTRIHGNIIRGFFLALVVTHDNLTTIMDIDNNSRVDQYMHVISLYKTAADENNEPTIWNYLPQHFQVEPETRNELSIAIKLVKEKNPIDLNLVAVSDSDSDIEVLEQTPLPTAEELNLDVQMEKERRALEKQPKFSKDKKKNKKPRPSKFIPEVSHIPYWLNEEEKEEHLLSKKLGEHARQFFLRKKNEVPSLLKYDGIYHELHSEGIDKTELLIMFSKPKKSDFGLMVNKCHLRGFLNDLPQTTYIAGKSAEYVVKLKANGTFSNDLDFLFNTYSKLVVSMGSYQKAYKQILHLIENTKLDLVAIYYFGQTIRCTGLTDHKHSIFKNAYEEARTPVPVREILKLIDARNQAVAKYREKDFPWMAFKNNEHLRRILHLDSLEVQVQNSFHRLLRKTQLPKYTGLMATIARLDVSTYQFVTTGKRGDKKFVKVDNPFNYDFTESAKRLAASRKVLEELPLDVIDPEISAKLREGATTSENEYSQNLRIQSPPPSPPQSTVAGDYHSVQSDDGAGPGFVRNTYEKIKYVGGLPFRKARAGIETLTTTTKGTYENLVFFLQSLKATAAGLAAMGTIIDSITAFIATIKDYLMMVLGFVSDIIEGAVVYLLTGLMNLGAYENNITYDPDEITIHLLLALVAYLSSGLVRAGAIAILLHRLGLITEVTKAIKFLKKKWSGEKGPEMENTSIMDLVAMLTGSLPEILSVIFCGIAMAGCGWAATTSNRMDIANIAVQGLRGMHFGTAGLLAIPKLFEFLTTTITNVVEYIRKQIGCENTPNKTKDVAEMAITFYTIVEVIRSEDGLKQLRRSKHLQDKVLDMRANWIKLNVWQSTEEFRKMPISMQTSVRLSVSRYQEIYNYVIRCQSQAGSRHTTFHIQLIGEPGVGKSTIMTGMAKELGDRLYPGRDLSTLLWSRGQTDHFDGYANQPITLFDDIWAVDEAKAMTEVLHLVTNTKTPLPMAHLTDKGIFWDSPIMISSTNIAYPNISGIYCQEAVHRRRDVLIRTKCDKQVKGASGRFELDLAKKYYPQIWAGTQPTPEYYKMPWLTFDIIKPVRTFKQGEPDTMDEEWKKEELPAGFRFPMKGLTYKQLMAMIFNRYRSAHEAEKLALVLPNIKQEELNTTFLAIEELVRQNRGGKHIMDCINIGRMELPLGEDTFDSPEITQLIEEAFEELSKKNPSVSETADHDAHADLQDTLTAFQGDLDDGTPDLVALRALRNQLYGGAPPDELPGYTAEIVFPLLFNHEALSTQMHIPPTFCLPNDIDVFFSTFPTPMFRPRLQLEESQRVLLELPEMDYSVFDLHFLSCFNPDETFNARKMLGEREYNNIRRHHEGNYLLRYPGLICQFEAMSSLDRRQRATLVRHSRRVYVACLNTQSLVSKMWYSMANVGNRILDAVRENWVWFLNKIITKALGFIIVMYLVTIVVLVIGAIASMFCAEETSKPEKTSRVFYKKGPSVVARTSFMEGISDQRVEELVVPNLKNVVSLQIAGAGVRSGIGIDGQFVLTAYHQIDRFKKQGIPMTVYYRTGRNMTAPMECLVKPEHIIQIPDSDACLLYSKQFPMASRIKHRFYTEKTLKNVQPTTAFLNYMDEHNVMHDSKHRINEIVDCFEYDDHRQTTLIYRGTPPKGSSGGMINAPVNHTNESIIGIQVARYQGNAYACIITQEALENAIQQCPVRKIVMEDPDVEYTLTPTSTEDLFTEPVRIIGKVEDDKVLGISTKSVFSRTILAEEFPSEREPAILNAFDPRVPTGTHPMQHSINKYGRHQMKPLPEKVLKRARKDITNHIKTILPRTPRILTMEEAILGLPTHGCMNLKTSPGIPWVYERISGYAGKKGWIRKNELGELTYIAPELRQRVEEFIISLKKGVIPPTLMYEFPKDELRPQEKVLKARSISVNDMALTIIGNMYLLDVTNMLHDLAKTGKIPFTVGVDPMSLTWTKMFQRLKRFQHRCSDADINNWDGHMTPQLIHAVAEIFISLMKECEDFGEEEAVLVLAVLLQMVFAFVQILNVIIHTMRGMKSGFFRTAEVNTIAHWLIFLCFYYLLTENTVMCLYVCFLRLVVIFVYGDDIIFAISPEIPITPRDIYDKYEYYGWPVSAADKISDVGDYKELKDLQFLKRHFVPDERLGEGLILAQIEKSVINDLLHWQRKQSNQEEQFYVNIDEALEFSFAHGKKFYKDVITRINNVLRMHDMSVVLLPYEDQRRKILGRIFE
nr:MAG: putative RNA-dependent RNA polymerase [Polycipiviridae sp.]